MPRYARHADYRGVMQGETHLRYFMHKLDGLNTLEEVLLGRVLSSIGPFIPKYSDGDAFLNVTMPGKKQRITWPRIDKSIIGAQFHFYTSKLSESNGAFSCMFIFDLKNGKAIDTNTGEILEVCEVVELLRSSICSQQFCNLLEKEYGVHLDIDAVESPFENHSTFAVVADGPSNLLL
ncbi:Uncharacterised protein [BD1-7 clade bacterium]|uniref:Uncharacterized protein n=1 Tax=BD1-7 clade bacterium TaxID=2029982 RepID=A0A5S9Q6X4_9GAMM|nr:Uncharacterised protein [BD1-7 clade bacterium]